jgi:hypothetical protein
MKTWKPQSIIPPKIWFESYVVKVASLLAKTGQLNAPIDMHFMLRPSVIESNGEMTSRLELKVAEWNGECDLLERRAYISE